MTTVVGQKRYASAAIFILASIVLDIFIFIRLGAGIVFFAALAYTLYQVYESHMELKKSIVVDETGVKINGQEYTYDKIVLAQARSSFFIGVRVTITVEGGKQYHFSVSNFQEVALAITNNKTIVNNAAQSDSNL